MPQDLDVNQLNTSIKSANAGWATGRTSVSELFPGQQRKLLGYASGPGEESLEQRVCGSRRPCSGLGFTIVTNLRDAQSDGK